MLVTTTLFLGQRSIVFWTLRPLPLIWSVSYALLSLDDDYEEISEAASVCLLRLANPNVCDRIHDDLGR
jgi:hypothetical protein